MGIGVGSMGLVDVGNDDGKSKDAECECSSKDEECGCNSEEDGGAYDSARDDDVEGEVDRGGDNTDDARAGADTNDEAGEP
jgi:hypothetical protein